MTAIEEHPRNLAAHGKSAHDSSDGTLHAGDLLSSGADKWGEDPEGEPVGGVANTVGGKLPSIPADKPVFTSSVAADLLGLHPRTLRIYEEKQLVVPARTAGNRRRYSPNDINRFNSIRKLTNGGVNLEGVRIILAMADELAQLGGDPQALIERNLASSGR
ncbi:MAG TPA: MerR family transcriptional regulator [Chloroflexia bacterium]|nr:MerR family transcriptional regulator [Chloroflexia bacterium]